MNASGGSRLGIVIVGCGRVGAVLGAAWHRAGHRIFGVTARSDTSRLRAEALLPHVPIVSLLDIGSSADLVLLAVPDSALGDVACEWASQEPDLSNTFVAHPAGAHGLEVLGPLNDLGATPLSIHPAFPFTGTSLDLQRLAGAAFGVTAPEGYRTVAEALVVELGGEPVWIPEEARVGYHAALALAANYSMTLLNESIELLSAGGAEHPERILGPLVRASVETALERGDRGQTGPIVRGDASTVARHLEFLAEVPLAAQAYRALGILTVDRLLAAGMLTGRQASPVLDSLESGK